MSARIYTWKDDHGRIWFARRPTWKRHASKVFQPMRHNRRWIWWTSVRRAPFGVMVHNSNQLDSAMLHAFGGAP